MNFHQFRIWNHRTLSGPPESPRTTLKTLQQKVWKPLVTFAQGSDFKTDCKDQISLPLSVSAFWVHFVWFRHIRKPVLTAFHRDFLRLFWANKSSSGFSLAQGPSWSSLYWDTATGPFRAPFRGSRLVIFEGLSKERLINFYDWFMKKLIRASYQSVMFLDNTNSMDPIRADFDYTNILTDPNNTMVSSTQKSNAPSLVLDDDEEIVAGHPSLLEFIAKRPKSVKYNSKSSIFKIYNWWKYLAEQRFRKRDADSSSGGTHHTTCSSTTVQQPKGANRPNVLDLTMRKTKFMEEFKEKQEW